jgi:hypothetical protein
MLTDLQLGKYQRVHQDHKARLGLPDLRVHKVLPVLLGLLVLPVLKVP